MASDLEDLEKELAYLKKAKREFTDLFGQLEGLGFQLQDINECIREGI